MALKQIDCFSINMKFWTILGIWPGNVNPFYYKYYSKIFITIFIVIYNSLFTISFYFVEKHLDSIVEDMIFYFTEIACTSKVFTFLLMRENISEMLTILESDLFQPVTTYGLNIIRNAKDLNVRYWKILASVAVTCHIAHIFIPIFNHFSYGSNLDMPVCSYSFLSDDFKENYKYILYLYQSAGIHATMWYTVNVNTFVLGVMVLIIAQLDILHEKLALMTDYTETQGPILKYQEKENQIISKFNKCIIHYDKISKFCALMQRMFSITLFTQFSMSAYIMCVCLFRFTLPAPARYYIFLGTYMICMILEVLLPCWFGSQIIERSTNLARAIYSCDWTIRCQQFRSNMRFFVVRATRPLTITGWKMFPLSLKTFTAIMKSAYSAFALLRHMQARQ